MPSRCSLNIPSKIRHISIIMYSLPCINETEKVINAKSKGDLDDLETRMKNLKMPAKHNMDSGKSSAKLATNPTATITYQALIPLKGVGYQKLCSEGATLINELCRSNLQAISQCKTIKERIIEQSLLQHLWQQAFQDGSTLFLVQWWSC